MDAEIGVKPAVLDVLSKSRPGEFRRLFARRIEYHLLWAEGNSSPEITLAKAEASGTEGRAGISAHLDYEQTLDLLAAFDGSPSRLCLSAKIHYQTEGDVQTVNLSGSWAEIYDFLQGHQNESGRIRETQLCQLLPIIAEDLISVKSGDGSTIKLPFEDLARLFKRQSSVILRRDPESLDGEVWYTLRSRPHEGFRLNHTESISTTTMQAIELFASLDRILGGVLDGRNWSDHVLLLAERPDDPAITSPVTKRKVAQRSQRIDRGDKSSIKMGAVDGNLMSLSLATRPSTDLPVRLIAKKPAQTFGVIRETSLDDLRLDLIKPAGQRVMSLPIITDRNDPYWSDRIDAAKLWYAPVFEVVEPAPNADPSNSSFLFSFERFGFTSTGEPALRGTIRFTLRPKMSEKTALALRRVNRGNASPVHFESLFVSLFIPFVDVADGQIKQHSFEASVQNRGDTIVATVPIINEWIRLAYGSLAIEGFQESSAQVSISYTFKGYVPIRNQNLELAFGGKTLHTEVVYSDIEAAKLRGTTTYLDATTLTYVQPREEMRFKREAAGQASRNTLLFESARLARPNELVDSSVKATAKPLIASTTAVRPQLTVSSNVEAIIREVKYATRTEVQQQNQPILIPCNRLGSFYQEIQNSVPTSIGCQDTLKLGQTRYHQYEEISELGDSAYKVYRSLQQPGHFLVVPTDFCISRRAPGDPNAYRPLIFLNALIDASVPANNRVELRATLEPDLPPFKRSALKEQLKAYSQEPTIHYPTDIPIETASFSWAMDPAIYSEADILEVSDPLISTYFRMDLASWQLMRTVLVSPGISGIVSFKLSDGSNLFSNLLLKLDQIRGPWQSGPLDVAVQNGQVRLTNHIERTVDVSDLVRYAGGAVAERVPVEISLTPGQSHAVSAGSGLQPIYSYPRGDPVAIREVRSFVEDIYSNLIFINLLNFSNYNLVRLDIEARLQGVSGHYTAQLTEAMPVADIPIVLPLTTYLDKRVLEFRVTKIFKDREGETTGWMQWDLDTTVPVSLTKEVLGL
ncbi:MAG: hypothetical protein HPY61_14740 [Methanotrichaceae archaeon]|nr:hypothetical protein [Methanotrichaceae archaeon]